jgi:hypothetical protein
MNFLISSAPVSFSDRTLQLEVLEDLVVGSVCGYSCSILHYSFSSYLFLLFLSSSFRSSTLLSIVFTYLFSFLILFYFLTKSL